MRNLAGLSLSPFVLESEKRVTKFSPDGKVITKVLQISVGKGQIVLWDLSSSSSTSLKAKKIQTLSGKSSEVMSIAFSPDGRTLASAGSSAIEFWHLT